jgi:DNA mismatch repair ATPase MutS
MHHSITFLFKLVRGKATRSFGMNVARLAGMPREIIGKAASKSIDLENAIEAKRSNDSAQQALAWTVLMHLDDVRGKGLAATEAVAKWRQLQQQLQQAK